MKRRYNIATNNCKITKKEMNDNKKQTNICKMIKTILKRQTNNQPTNQKEMKNVHKIMINDLSVSFLSLSVWGF